MVAMSQKQVLDAIFDKTAHIRGGLAAMDMDIVINALDERETLIASYISGNYAPLSGECAQVASRIAQLDRENTDNLKKMMDECNEKVLEARRKIKELQTGKKAATQYHGGGVAVRSSALDFKQ